MDKVIAFSNKTEARDKFTKAIQYISKLFAWALAEKDKSLHKKFSDLSSMAKESRKIFRLFRSLQEVKNITEKLRDLLIKKHKTPILLEIMSRIGYLIYWVFDNFYLLASVKIIKSNSATHFSKVAHMGWLFGILWAILKNLYELIYLLSNKDISIGLMYEHSFNNKEYYHRIIREQEILRLLIEILGKLGDIIPACSGSGLDKKYFRLEFSDGAIGIGGAISSCIAMWGIWHRF
jgi:hypothetical protein